MNTSGRDQLNVLNGLPKGAFRFEDTLQFHGCAPLRRETVRTFQINVGKLCNQACHHCHVEAGPKRTEIMETDVAEKTIALLKFSPQITCVDITGGAPELNRNFRYLVEEARRLDRHVIDRCNLTVLYEPDMHDLVSFLASHEVAIVASLPCYTAANVDKQRGRGVFDKSIRALQELNAIGYGLPRSTLQLNLVYNPTGATLPPQQKKLESDYKQQLREHFGIEFHNLFTITNMPIRRFADFLWQNGQHEEYMSLLVNHFNPLIVESLMCRSLISVGWDGKLYDCDFNQMLDLGLGTVTSPKTIWELESFESLAGLEIATGSHCFGCTAGSGSGCGGALG
ncbi:MAG: arsenosugar biosynthesis radical SAM protein ArsS [Acidobacteriales bacterium]|nr:arsenosugar biosynthesis radical SAM protein ArsS [Terriglobales bacterium]